MNSYTLWVYDENGQKFSSVYLRKYCAEDCLPEIQKQFDWFHSKISVSIHDGSGYSIKRFDNRPSIF